MKRRNVLLAGAGTLALPAYLTLTSEGALAQGQGRTLLLAAPGTPEGFDGDALRPGTQETVVQVYEGLTRYGRVTRGDRSYLDPSVIEGHLAERWTVSDDGLRYVFTLRQGVRSPFGNELTAADVEWSWAKSFAQRRTGFFIANVSNVTGVKALSQREVEFTLNAPSSIFLAALTLYVPGIYDSAEAKKHATAEDPWALRWMETNTAGFGAYHVRSVRAGEQAEFVANPNYFRGRPHFERVIYRAVPSGASRTTLLRSGQVQWIDRPTVQQVLDMQRDRRVKIQDQAGRAMASVRMNAAMRPFDDVRVRRAMNFAVNKDAIRQGVTLGTGEIARSIVPPIVGGYDPSFFMYDHDPARARALLAEAGFPNGFEVDLLFSNIWWWEEPMAVQLADQLRAVGVTARPQRITGSDLRARGAPNRQDMALFTFEDGPIVLDPVYTISLLARSDGVSNRARYANPAFDALVDRARTSPDRAVQAAAVREAQRVWMEDALWILTVYPQTFEAMAPNISGWVPHPDEHERWVDLRVA
ncbi:ABC transporter substrate-binding protein [Falsiroseomonas oryziterrae]|uniref:ABC transporter substrate-binding protein n=1 Tax=Falsiroseomonas oryziterrae TaxID=2911368 RepID=UPI001F23758A|nr:ABC transporter substrate-binding protein [Roseomonas sp. NPKOSM-4]